MEKQMIVLVALILAIAIITLGLVGWQTGFAVKNQNTDTKVSGVKVVDTKNDVLDDNDKEEPVIPPRTTSLSGSSGSSSGSSGSSSSGGSNTGGNNPGNNPGSDKLTIDIIVDVPISTHTKDSEFEVNIKISSESKIYAADLELTYNSEILEVLKVTKGNFLGQDGAETYEIIKENGGNTVFASTRLGGEGISGEGILAILKIKAKGVGNSDLILDSVKIVDTSLEFDKFNINKVNGKVTII